LCFPNVRREIQDAVQISTMVSRPQSSRPRIHPVHPCPGPSLPPQPFLPSHITHTTILILTKGQSRLSQPVSCSQSSFRMKQPTGDIYSIPAIFPRKEPALRKSLSPVGGYHLGSSSGICDFHIVILNNSNSKV
jgi:hypothetical protein